MEDAFWWGYNIKNFFFHGFTISSVGGLIATCIGLALMSILFEYLKLLQAKQRQKELIHRSRNLRAVCPNTETATLLQNTEPAIVTRKDRLFRFLLYLTDAVLWLASFNLSYIIMLAVMVFNGWLTIAIILGGGIGYFIFGHRFMKINLQNCQTLRETYCILNCGSDPATQNGETTPTVEASTSSAHLPVCHDVVEVHSVPNEDKD